MREAAVVGVNIKEEESTPSEHQSPVECQENKEYQLSSRAVNEISYRTLGHSSFNDDVRDVQTTNVKTEYSEVIGLKFHFSIVVVRNRIVSYQLQQCFVTERVALIIISHRNLSKSWSYYEMSFSIDLCLELPSSETMMIKK